MQIRVSSLVVAGAAVLLLARLVMGAPSAATDEVAKDKAVYQQKLQEIKQECVASKGDVLVRYRKALDATRLVVQQSGVLEAVQAVDAEIKRFEKNKSLPAGMPRAANAELVKVIKVYREALEKVDVDAAQKAIDCTDRYLLFLEQRKKQMVREDKLDLAKAYDQCMKGAKETPEYQEARFLLHDRSGHEAANKPNSTADPADSAKPLVAGGGGADAPLMLSRNGKTPRHDSKGLYDAERIYEASAGSSLSTSTTSSYRPLVVSDTGKAPVSGGVGIALDGILDDTNAKYQLRIKLRAKTSNASFANLKVLAQYFGKGFNNSPVQEAAGFHFVLIPSLMGGKNVNCELKSMALPYATVYQYWVAPYSYVKQGSFVGVIVSVFSDDDKLIAQVTSSSGLKEKGKLEFDLPPAWQASEKPAKALREGGRQGDGKKFAGEHAD